jgi:molybdate transport system ATP-binding protein
MLQVDIRLQRGTFRLDANFTAPVPGVTALFGRSGCGKTTVVNLLAGLIREGEGRLALDDEIWFDSARGICVPAERRRIGYVFQDARLFPHYTVRGNLLYGAPRGATGTSSAFEELVGLLGIESLLQRRPGALSGGERQRVALGRALLAQPRLLLLDEPLASLDASRRDEVLPWLARLRDHYAIPMVFVSHQFDEVLRVATHLVVMDAGRVVAAGEVNAVSLTPALRGMVGPDAAGAVVEGRVVGIDAANELATIAIGNDVLRVSSRSLVMQQSIRVQLLARDLILAIEEPRGLSVRNQLRGSVRSITADGNADLVEVDVGGVTLLARITAAATRELSLAPGSAVWVLVKAVSFNPHAIGAAVEQASRQ